MRRGYDFFSFFLSNGKGEGGRGRVVRMEERDGVMREKEGDRALGTGGVEGRDAARATESWPLIPFLACGAETASSPAGPGRPLLSAVGAETASSSPSSAGLPSGRRRPRAPPPPAASAGRAGDRGRAGTGGRQEAPSAVGLKSHRVGDGVITSRGRRLHRGAGDPRGPQGGGRLGRGRGPLPRHARRALHVRREGPFSLGAPSLYALMFFSPSDHI